MADSSPQVNELLQISFADGDAAQGYASRVEDLEAGICIAWPTEHGLRVSVRPEKNSVSLSPEKMLPTGYGRKLRKRSTTLFPSSWLSRSERSPEHSVENPRSSEYPG